jgi:hypothetical protein
MAAFLTTPLALAGLLAAPALVAIYLFRHRPKAIEVSSLLLWARLRRPKGGGRTAEPPRFPLTFWLELAMIVLLALAAAGPLVPWIARDRPLIVILDDSLSMQLARGRASDFLQRDIVKNYRPIQYVLAGATPQLARLKDWSCSATNADIDGALALAMQLGERDALILVVTDHAPEREPGARTRWMAFGRSEPNVGFVAAARSSQRVMVELANFSTRPASTSLVAGSYRQTLQLGANSRRGVAIDLPPSTGDVEIHIDDDAAAFDNRVTLLAEREPPLRVSLNVVDERLRADLERALVATQRAVVVPGAESLLEADTRSGISHAGPYYIDRTHPVTEGLSLDGVIWTAANVKLPGQPLIIAGNQPLMTEDAGKVHIALDPALSNLQSSPAWPALIWNIVEWRSRMRPGVRPANVSVGSSVEVSLPPGMATTTVQSPDGSTRSTGRTIIASRPGIWKVNGSYRFSANALVPQESDLQHNTTGEKSSWGERALTLNGFRNIAPLLLLAALIVAAAHLRVVRATA